MADDLVVPEEVIRTFLECLDIDLTQMSPEENKKINTITHKSVVDLCYILVPEVENLVSPNGVFYSTNPPQNAAAKAFFNEQRKAFFAVVSGIVRSKRTEDASRDLLEKRVDALSKELDKMSKRIQTVIKLSNEGRI